MAAGRHGGYRENEFRDRELDFGVSRRRDYYYYKEDYDRLRDGAPERDRSHRRRDLERGKEGNYQDRAKIRQRDVKERELENGAHRSGFTSNDSVGGSGDQKQGGHYVKTAECTSNDSDRSSGDRKKGRHYIRMAERTSNDSDRSSGDQKKSQHYVKIAEREPGELSSGSGSDDGVISELQAGQDNESEGWPQSPPGKKRKFSPIVWDREENKANIPAREKSDASSIPLSFPWPQELPKPGSVNQHEAAEPSTTEHNLFHSLQPSPFKLRVAPGSAGSAVSSSPAWHSEGSPLGITQGNDHLPEHFEEEDNVPMRNISTSRWADEVDSSEDEGEILDDESMSKWRKKMLVVETVDAKLHKMSSHELKDLSKEGREGACTKSSSSDGGGRNIQIDSTGESADFDSKKNDLMDSDGEGTDDCVSGHLVEMDLSENDSLESPDPVKAPQRGINMLQGCRSVHEFEKLNRIDEGTYGVVFRAKDKRTGEIVALKKVKMENEREGFPLTSLREINILLSLNHSSIVNVKEVVVGNKLDDIFMVMEYMEHDLKGLMETMKQPFSQSEVKCLMLQLLEGVKYLHDNWVLHRDLKTSNLLMNNCGELKICDFGLSRQYGSPLKPYTHLVVTLWYRAPELLLGSKEYSTAIDMWSLGCIMAELLAREPLFNGKTELDQLDKIFRTLGTPNETIWPGLVNLPGFKAKFIKQPYNKLREKFPPTSFAGRPTLSEAGFDLLNKLLTYDHKKRITAEAALNHEWFREVPLPKSKDFMPTFPAQHAQDRRQRRILKSPDPLEEQRRRELLRGNSGTGHFSSFSFGDHKKNFCVAGLARHGWSDVEGVSFLLFLCLEKLKRTFPLSYLQMLLFCSIRTRC